jgi:hypothetical protein
VRLRLSHVLRWAGCPKELAKATPREIDILASAAKAQDVLQAHQDIPQTENQAATCSALNMECDAERGNASDPSSGSLEGGVCHMNVQELVEYYGILCASWSISAGDYELMHNSLELLSLVMSALWGKGKVFPGNPCAWRQCMQYVRCTKTV